jgi:putative ABC transport system substrate-binding protein
MNWLKFVPFLKKSGFFYFLLDNRAMRIPPKDRSTAERRSLTLRALRSASDMRAMLLCLISLLLLASVPVSAADKVPVVGWLRPTSSEREARLLDAFRQGLRDLGHEEGRTLVIEARSARGDNSQYPELARDLMEHRPAVIVSDCGQALRAIREVSRTMPVVAICADPINFLGEVASLRRPGGQTTGLLLLAPESAGKRLELLKELKPKLSRVAVLQHSGDNWDNYWKEMEPAAQSLGITLSKAPIKRAEDLESAVAAAVRRKAEALIVFPDPTTQGASKRIAGLAIKHRLLTAFDMRSFVDAGGLFYYGPKLHEFIGNVTTVYVDKILKGATPGDLPVQQPTLFELVVNLRTARALGLSVPQSFLFKADEVLK